MMVNRLFKCLKAVIISFVKNILFLTLFGQAIRVVLVCRYEKATTRRLFSKYGRENEKDAAINLQGSIII